MKECPECKTENAETAKFCSACGALLPQVEMPKDGQEQNCASADVSRPATKAGPQSKNETTVRKMFRFSSSSEKFLASIGNSFIENFLTGGKVSQTIAALTDKRLYYHGRTLTGNGLKLSKMTEEGSVMVRDITYTGFTHSDPKWMKIVGIILTVFGGYCMFDTIISLGGSAYLGIFLLSFFLSSCFLMSGILLFRKYKQQRTSIFIIRFAGGGLKFNVNLYPVEESKQFQDALNRAIDDGK